MQVNSVLYTASTTQINKDGKTLPVDEKTTTEMSKKSSTIRDLAQSIDPSNMSRNEAREIANALMSSGEGELSTVFFSHSVVLIPNEDGTFRHPTESDPIMNEKFNMFDAIRSNLEFKQSKGQSIEQDLSALSFLEKFKIMASHPEMNTYV